ncbi:family 16 glycoside hydrolase [Micromonospora rifamycinica]|uniref:Glucose/arabinose dehydrogenase, beta-propeller fold n=1 Tax=Micromonospora rifamycinica TaxID=291594 RepID=A0A1C5J513_9ACTN|nr:family 16 glycoside hydrolase [Micromonospora rifamycinica]SCG65637.1 Glucose/arabinose dehydrogenase, beta-propeller fold [Micromonospora rifamycinica]
MTTPHRRRWRPRPVLVAAGTALATVLASASVTPATAAPAADVPPQEPGVTLRAYDMGTPLSALCTLKPAQTPNVDKLMPQINWTSTEDFGLADRFVTHVTGNLAVPVDGSYAFRLTSDDGSRLTIGDTVVVDHDGLHGETAEEGSATLTAGLHPLRVEHFDDGGGQVLRLEWRPPGAAGFTLVPTSALSTDAGVVRVTAPGWKYCEGATDSAGDGLPLDRVHPGYTLTDLRPDGFRPQVTGMAFRPDGTLVLSTWGGTDNATGEIYLVEGATGATGPDRVTYRRFADGLREPQGVAVVDGTVYVSQKHELTALRDTDGDGVADDRCTVATWPWGGNFHEFAFGLLYRDGFFHLNLSVAINQGGATTVPQPAPNRGTSIKVNARTGKITYLAGGLRTPNGIGWGPRGEVLVTDNQGGWLPASKLVQIRQGAFFNHYTSPDGPFDDKPVTRPIVWLPQNEVGNSPSTPVLLAQGPYAGQLVVGDVTYGGLQRVYLDEVEGQYQGAVFRHTQGLEAGVNEVTLGPDGAVYVGGVGAGGNWGQEGKLSYGLQKLTPNGTSTFEVKQMRATANGFDLEYTEPVSAETAARLAEAYQVTQWRYGATSQYGGPKLDLEKLTVTRAVLAANGRTVRLRIPGLKENRVVHVRSPRPFSAADGEQLWNTEAWYTLNEIPGRVAQPQTFFEAEEGRTVGVGMATDHAAYSGAGFAAGFADDGASTRISVDVPEAGNHDLAMRYSNGPNPFSGPKQLSLYVNGKRIEQTVFPSTVTWEEWGTVTTRAHLRRGRNIVEYRKESADSGHVNLDVLAVRPRGERITLFDGGDLTEWQHTDGREPEWTRDGNTMTVQGGDLRTVQAFGDFRLHVEFNLPLYPPEVTGQQRANSGVYLQDRYEIQVLDSFGVDPPQNNDAAAIYTQKAPDVNAARPPQTWQTYDIEYRQARYDAAGVKVANPRVTVVWNGVTVHDDVEILGPTGGSRPEGPAAGAIRLQDHGNPVRYRNIWIKPLDG